MARGARRIVWIVWRPVVGRAGWNIRMLWVLGMFRVLRMMFVWHVRVSFGTKLGTDINYTYTLLTRQVKLRTKRRDQ